MLNSIRSILQKQPTAPSTPTPDNPITEETKSLKKKYGNLSGKGGIVLHGMLAIHSNIINNEALEGYEGLPLQLERLMWECYGIMAKNPNIKTAEEINEKWMEDYADGWVELEANKDQ